MQKISKFLHPCNLCWIFSLMTCLMFVEVASELSSVNMANKTTCPLHSSFFIHVLLSLPFESNSGSLMFKNSLLVMCLLLPDYPHGYLHFALCPWWWEYGHVNGSGALLHPLFVESIFVHVVVKVWSIDTWMGVEHFFIHCSWFQFSCGLWTKAPTYFIQFQPSHQVHRAISLNAKDRLHTFVDVIIVRSILVEVFSLLHLFIIHLLKVI